jgi:PAS domain S-box-containing protein
MGVFSSVAFHPDLFSSAPMKRSLLVRYIVAALLVIATLPIVIWLRPFSYTTPHVYFYPAILIAVWFGELGPALLATVLSAFAVNYFQFVPYHRLSLDPASVFRSIFFCLTVGTMCWFIDKNRARAEVAEEALAESREDLLASEDRLAKIISSAMDAIITLDQNQRIVVFNAAAEKVFCCSKWEALGRPIDRFIPERFREVHRGHIRDFESTGASSRSMQSPGTLYGLRANGEEFPLEATISQVNAKGTKLYTVILRDITLRKKTEAALIKSEKLAVLGRLASMIAHEINSPLQAISDLLYLAQGCAMDSSPAQYLQLANAELKRAAQIADATLGFSRASGRITKFRPTEALESILTLLDRKLQAKQVVCERDYLTDTEICGVESEIRQVLWNLLNNSLDAVSPGGRIKLRISSSLPAVNEAGVRIIAADNGHGISPTTLPSLFEPFFTTKENGNGLGLWVVSEIVKKHHGTIHVRSRTAPRHPTGTAFCIFLPANAMERADLQPTPPTWDQGMAAGQQAA